jgi:8-oxo-dGTP diphosphatase
MPNASGATARPIRLARPRIAVDVVPLAFQHGRLQCYLVQLKGGAVAGQWAFPGGLVQRGELLDDAARRELEAATGLRDTYTSNSDRLADSSFGRSARICPPASPSAPLVPHGLTGSARPSDSGLLADLSRSLDSRTPSLTASQARPMSPHGLTGSATFSDSGRLADSRPHGLTGSAYLEQLFTFGDPSRDPLAHVVSVAYMALTAEPDRINNQCGKYAKSYWCAITALPPLAYDHAAVATYALNRLRGKLAYTNIAAHLLPESFTFAELEDLYASVLERPLDRRNFRRRIMAAGLLHPLGRMRRGAHRPAALYGFARRSLQTVEML